MTKRPSHFISSRIVTLKCLLKAFNNEKKKFIFSAEQNVQDPILIKISVNRVPSWSVNDVLQN